MTADQASQVVEVMGVSVSHWYKLGVALSVVLLLQLVLHFVIPKIADRLTGENRPYASAFYMAMRKPLVFIIWIAGFFYCLKISARYVDDGFVFHYLDIISKVLILCSVIWFLLRFSNRMQQAMLAQLKRKRIKSEKSIIIAVAKISEVIIFVIGFLMLLGILNINIAGLLTFGGLSAAVIAFSAKEVIENFFGGVLIYFNRPFSVGDWIYSPDKNIEGYVEEIGWRLTKIRNFMKRPMYVPNGLFNSIVLVNASRMSNRRIKQYIGVRYDDLNVLPKILEEVRVLFDGHPDIDQNMIKMANVSDFGASSVNIMIYLFTKTKQWDEYLKIQDDIFFKINEIVEKHGAEWAFPTTTLHVPEGIRFEGTESGR